VPDLLTISEVSRRSGVAASALRFYEDRGLITSERSGSGHRRFRRPVLRRIAFVVFAQRVGLTLEEIGAELAEIDATDFDALRRLLPGIRQTAVPKEFEIVRKPVT